EVLGISGGALAGVVLLVILAPAASYAALAGAGTLGALVTVGGLMWFTRRHGYAPERLLLAGVAVKALFDGVLGLVAASGVPFWTRLLNWVSGSTYGAGWDEVLGGLLAVVVVVPVVLALGRWLQLLGLGDEQARARGMLVARARMVLLVLAAVATAVATLLIGPLSFVGLMAPHMALMLGLRRVGTQLAGACGIGAGLMVLADWAGRTLLVPGEVPAGIAASLIGGIYFMYLLRRL
ncbi:MAG TPA: iron chelate uptake ABC transporter family permease subunit, partial [Arenicellales bacterium]|nr:iron chelate uptake ABC transporter family permease subunit [Arenicellales bacterium]